MIQFAMIYERAFWSSHSYIVIAIQLKVCIYHNSVMLFSLFVGFGLVWSIPGDKQVETFFGLYVLFLLCVLAGLLVPYIKLPPLLGKVEYT